MTSFCWCLDEQANGACPLQCTKSSPAGCSERFQCWQGCPACLPPPINRACYGCKQVQHRPDKIALLCCPKKGHRHKASLHDNVKAFCVHNVTNAGMVQIEIGQLDTTIGFQEVPYGNLTYWFDSSSLYLSINLTQGMTNKPIGVYVFKGTPPTGPPPQLDSQVIAPAVLSFGSVKDWWNFLILFSIFNFYYWRRAIGTQMEQTQIGICSWHPTPLACRTSRTFHP